MVVVVMVVVVVGLGSGTPMTSVVSMNSPAEWSKSGVGSRTVDALILLPIFANISDPSASGRMQGQMRQMT